MSRWELDLNPHAAELEQLIWVDKETGDRSVTGWGLSLRLLSSLDPSSPAEVGGVLGWDLSQPRKESDSLRYSLLPCSPSGETDPTVLVCHFSIESVGSGHYSSSWAPYAVVFDCPLERCYAWARRFEQTLKAYAPKVRMENRIGICQDCDRDLRPEWRQQPPWDAFR